MNFFRYLRILFLTLTTYLSVFSVRLTWTCYEDTGSCYYIPDMKLILGEASCWCQAAGGHLLIVDTVSEWSQVATSVDNLTDANGFWVGATDKNKDNNFMWENGTPASESLPWLIWSKGEPEPQSNKGEHCVTISHVYWWTKPPTRIGRLVAFNTQCSDKRQFICEKTIKI